MLFRIFTSFVLSCALACAEDAPPWPTETWPVSTPAAQQMDGDRLDGLVSLIRAGDRFPDLHSLLVVRNGYIVCEAYFDGHTVEELHTLQSVSKSITSAAMGMAIEQKLIRGVEEKILDFFPDLEGIKNLDERKRDMTLENLLTMQSGTDYNEREPGSPHHQLNALSRGWTKFVLDRPMVSDPGTVFQYDSGGVILMSALIEARTDEHADSFIKEHLFKPLGIKRSRWYKNSEGHPHMGGGLHLTSRDMAKFGLLYLRGGRWEDRQVVPADWVEASVRQHVTFTKPYDKFVGYGYLWWILPPPDGENHQAIFAACGFRAQYIFVVPEFDMVVVTTGGTQRWTDQVKPIRFLYSHIIPSVADME